MSTTCIRHQYQDPRFQNVFLSSGDDSGLS
jgi:hypothetical protein